MKRLVALSVLVAALVAAAPATAAADVTAFWGFSPTPANRSVKGFSVGLNLLIAGFEFELANTRQIEGAPALSTKMFNAVLATPTGGTQLYLTAGGGLFSETFRDRKESSVGTNVGGGIKLHLAGPLRLRVDYRIFSLHGDPLYKNPKRLYAGVNLSF